MSTSRSSAPAACGGARLSRRVFLRGAGVALALPWLESLAPRRARAQQVSAARRYIALYFPNGTADYWHPSGTGAGDAWKLSPILEPLAPVKPYLSVLTNVANYATFGGHVEPSHSNCCAAAWTCVQANGDNKADSAISIDQVIANQIGGSTLLPSLQVGLSTLDSYEDGLPGQHSRSISWKSATEPLYKVVNPQAVFDRLTSSAMPSGSAADAMAAMQRKALNKSLLDYVTEGATGLQRKLGSSDRKKLDQYLDAVRSLEKRVADPSMQVATASCESGARPDATYTVGNVPADYNRGAHASLMIDLVVMALQCDRTRVVSFMLDDARSDFVYDFIKERKFSDTGSVEGDNTVGGYHGLQHAGDKNDGFATIGWWNAQQAAVLAGKLAAIDEGDAGNLLDNSVITFACGMHSGDHDPGDLPIALIGGGGKTASGTVLKRDQRFMFGSEQRLADVHLTLMQHVFGCTDSSFGSSSGIIADLLA
jgi:hypothetical protein